MPHGAASSREQPRATAEVPQRCRKVPQECRHIVSAESCHHALAEYSNWHEKCFAVVVDVSIEILKVCAPVSFSALGSHMSVGNFSSKLLLSLLVVPRWDVHSKTDRV